MNHRLTMTLGLTHRHLNIPLQKKHDPINIITHNRIPSRHLALNASLNWCSSNNPLGRSVCGDIKSQKKCGSCWAFATADLIESAVSIATNDTPVSLSTQQLLMCSNGTQVHTFSYCFANTGKIPAWLTPQKQWSATNSGCGGGMTQNALTDAVNRIQNLAKTLDWPYTESNNNGTGTTAAKLKNSGNDNDYNTCHLRPANMTAAHVSGWEPAFNENSCQNTTDTAILLRDALNTGPLSVAIHAQPDTFPAYKGGVYSCPEINSSDMIDHALLLVGYDSDNNGDYWILKNSYGTSWGVNGFLYLKVDNVINCGLNVFPIRVLGASSGPAAMFLIDGGGNLEFAGIPMEKWVVVGAIIAGVAAILSTIGLFVAQTRRQNATCYWLSYTDTIVSTQELIDDFTHRFPTYKLDSARQNLIAHVAYIQDIYQHANALNHTLTMALGLHPIHQTNPPSRNIPAIDLVKINIAGVQTHHRRLSQTPSNSSLNWCSENNPKKRRVCGPVRQQQVCNSCWAFATTDLIASALSMANNKPPVLLSPQQLLTCSSNPYTTFIDYCYAGGSNIPTWLAPSVLWQSSNHACGGGSAFSALSDVSTESFNNGAIALDEDWPYVDGNSNATQVLNNTKCWGSLPSSEIAGYVKSWVPAIDASACTYTTRTVEMMKNALLKGPISVSMVTSDSFKAYKGGIFFCENEVTMSNINHILLLVGYDVVEGLEHWILKNSYGRDWGIRGYMHLATDEALNCGLHLLPFQITQVQSSNDTKSNNISYAGEGNGSNGGVELQHSTPVLWILSGCFVGLVFVLLVFAFARRKMKLIKVNIEHEF
ncbi:cysteine protease family C01A, partial [Thraustotheca clavata]